MVNGKHYRKIIDGGMNLLYKTSQPHQNNRHIHNNPDKQLPLISPLTELWKSYVRCK